MAHVLVAHSDEGVRDVIEAALRDVAGHEVVATSDGEMAIAALWLSERPMVALIDERLLPYGAMDVFRIAANDRAGGQLARHRYILLSTWPQHVATVRHDLLTHLDAPVLGLPFDLAALLRVVDELACGCELRLSASTG
jgi:DNA-binding NtrC family response regulator